MATTHVVAQGDTVVKLAARYGFVDWHTIWDDPANADLRKLRPNPDVLAPGDVVVIPDKTPRSFTAPTGERHSFKLRRSKAKLRLVLRDFDNEPLRDTKCTLSVEGKELELVTNGEGLIECSIPATAESAELRFQDPAVPLDLTIPIQIGHLDPVDTPSGQTARLNNLGYNAGSGGEAGRVQFEMAVQEFQVDNGLPVDGVCGPQTQAKLQEAHGS